MNIAIPTATLVILFSSLSLARLGDRVAPAQLPAGVQGKAAVAYEVRTRQENAVEIKEYVSRDGFVFAVSWRGVAEPNLSELLGSYFAEYDRGFRANRPSQRTRKSIVVESEQVVVKRFGHMRDLRGVAWVPSLVPAQVNVEELGR